MTPKFLASETGIYTHSARLLPKVGVESQHVEKQCVLFITVEFQMITWLSPKNILLRSPKLGFAPGEKRTFRLEVQHGESMRLEK